jgi:hypothetical protein
LSSFPYFQPFFRRPEKHLTYQLLSLVKLARLFPSDSREQADAYNSSGYSEVLKELNKLVEGTPQVKTYDVAKFDAAQHRRSVRSVIVRRGPEINRPSGAKIKRLHA